MVTKSYKLFIPYLKQGHQLNICPVSWTTKEDKKLLSKLVKKGYRIQIIEDYYTVSKW